MALIKHYATNPSIICDFGSTVEEAKENKTNTITSLETGGNIILSGYDDPENDVTLQKLKTAKNGYNDIYGNQTKYWGVIYR